MMQYPNQSKNILPITHNLLQHSNHQKTKEGVFVNSTWLNHNSKIDSVVTWSVVVQKCPTFFYTVTWKSCRCKHNTQREAPKQTSIGLHIIHRNIFCTLKSFSKFELIFLLRHSAIVQGPQHPPINTCAIPCDSLPEIPVPRQPTGLRQTLIDGSIPRGFPAAIGGRTAYWRVSTHNTGKVCETATQQFQEYYMVKTYIHAVILRMKYKEWETATFQGFNQIVINVRSRNKLDTTWWGPTVWLQ